MEAEKVHEIACPEDVESGFAAELDDEYGTPSRCNEFAFWYMRENDDVVVKLGRVGDDPHHGDWHVWAYDRRLDRTIDLTMRQFDAFEDFWAEGDHHPHCVEVDEYETHEAFVEEWDFGMESPFVIEVTC